MSVHAIVVDNYGDPSMLQWREVPEPQPGPGEVTIRVSTTGVNFADIMRRKGGYRGSPPPFTPGLDCTGTIVAVGSGVSDLRAGQRVAAFPADGGYAEIVRARAVLTYPLADEVPEEAAASLTVVVTAYNILTFAARAQRGESVLVHAAAGGVGSTSLQMAKALGLRTLAAAGGAEKVALAKQLGADAAFDNDELGTAGKEAAGERGVDIVLDSVAGPMMAASLPLLAEFGRYVIYGMASGTPGDAKSNVFHTGNRALLGYSTGGYRDARPEVLRPTVLEAYRFVAQHGIRIIVGARYALKDAAQAQQHVESRASHGKVLLTP